MKSGANVSEIKRIRVLSSEGTTIQKISQMLQIEESVVTAFIPKAVKKKRKTKKKA